MPPTHFTPENQVIAPAPPLVKSNTKALAFPLEAVLLTVNVVAPDTVCVKYVPLLKLIALLDVAVLV